MRGDITKYLFIDSEIGDGRISLPPLPFSAAGNEKMTLTLLSFSMNKRWPKINPTNNTFYIYDNVSDTYYEVQIPIGTYYKFAGSDGLEGGLQDIVGKLYATSTSALFAMVSDIKVGYEAKERAFTFDFTTKTGYNKSRFEIRCFHLKNGSVPAGVGRQGAFSDSYEILGCRPIRDSDKMQNSMVNAGGVLVSRYPVSLNTCDSLYLRFNLGVGNYESPGLDFKSQSQEQLQNSDIFAVIPIEGNDENLEHLHEIVKYTDSHDTYQVPIPQKSVEHLQFFVTDKRNRRLTEFDAGQIEDGLMNFNLVCRWDKFIGPKPEEQVKEAPIPPQLFPPQYGYGMPRI